MNNKWQSNIIRLGKKCWRLSQALADPSILKTYLYLRRHGLGMRPYEKWNLPWLKQAGIKTILDIGAHTGESFCLFKYIFNDANIYCFEPLYDSYTILINKVNNHPGSKAFNIALGDINGFINFYKNEFTAASSLLEMSSYLKDLVIKINQYPQAVNQTKISVPITKLDDYCLSENINIVDNLLIKLDVQGYEYKVILGGENVFKRAKVVITEVSFCEVYYGQVLFDGIYNLMSNNGFRFMGFLDEDISPIDGKILQADAIFLKGIN